MNRILFYLLALAEGYGVIIIAVRTADAFSGRPKRLLQVKQLNWLPLTSRFDTEKPQ
jgi:hypothetical protein